MKQVDVEVGLADVKVELDDVEVKLGEATVELDDVDVELADVLMLYDIETNSLDRGLSNEVYYVAVT